MASMEDAQALACELVRQAWDSPAQDKGCYVLVVCTDADKSICRAQSASKMFMPALAETLLEACVDVAGRLPPDARRRLLKHIFETVACELAGAASGNGHAWN